MHPSGKLAIFSCGFSAFSDWPRSQANSLCYVVLTRFGRPVALSGTAENAVAPLLLELEKNGGTEKQPYYSLKAWPE